MKKFLTPVVALLLAVCALFTFTACGNSQESTVNPRNKTITVGYTDYAPMNYTEDGVFKGFDTELAIMVFNALGYDVRFKLIEWSNKYVELNSNSIQCIWNGFTSNGADNGVPRSESVDFTYNYMQNAQCIIRKDTTAAVSSYEDFANKSVAFESGSAGQSLITDNTEGISVMKQGKVSQMEAVTAVNLGSADYAVVDVLLAEEIIKSYTSIVIDNGITIPVEYYAIGCVKDGDLDEKINIILEAFAQTGYLQELANKYNVGTMVITDFTSQK